MSDEPKPASNTPPPDHGDIDLSESFPAPPEPVGGTGEYEIDVTVRKTQDDPAPDTR